MVGLPIPLIKEEVGSVFIFNMYIRKESIVFVKQKRG
jgi:hypothetical protein